jgi:hypothetical protein
MAHYAFLDENNIVTEVITGKDDEGTNWEAHYGEFRNQVCKQTSYNTFGNQHKLGGTPFRGNYAGIGYTYDSQNDVFYAPQPYASWTLNQTTWLWEAPTPYPQDGKAYEWDEATTSWKEIA